MDDYDEQDELGENVTHLFKSDERKSTAILPVRLEHEEIARMERIGRDSGKTVFQVIRDAIAAYQPETEAVSGQR